MKGVHEMEATVAVRLDLKGLTCPIPIVRTAKAMKQHKPGQLAEIFAT